MMKKLLGLFMIFAITAIAMPLQAQTAQQVTVDYSDLTPTQQAQYNADKLITEQKAQLAVAEKKIEQFGDWVGVGGEVGKAIEEGLSAVVNVADEFTGTDVGKFTMILVAWKVMGKDVVKILLGMFFFGVMTLLVIRIYRNSVQSRRKLVLKTPQGFWKRSVKKYEIVDSKLDGEEKLWLSIVLSAVFLLGIWITYAIMF
jgi:hypothetical protein